MTASKARGTAFESLLVPELRQFYPQAQRNALSGSADTGDLFLPGEMRFVIEAKSVARLNLAGWYAEASAEAANFAAKWGLDVTPVPVVVHKRKGKGKGCDQWVTLTFRDFLTLVAP